MAVKVFILFELAAGFYIRIYSPPRRENIIQTLISLRPPRELDDIQIDHERGKEKLGEFGRDSTEFIRKEPLFAQNLLARL